MVVAPDTASLAIGATGANVTSVRIPEPFIDDMAQRRTDTYALLDASTDSEVRQELLNQYDPDSLVVFESQTEELLARFPGATIVGSVEEYAIVAVP